MGEEESKHYDEGMYRQIIEKNSFFKYAAAIVASRLFSSRFFKKKMT